MLKFLFWCLLLANAALFAYQQGYLNTLFPDGREPGRTAKQFNADKVKLVSASAATAAATPAPAPAPEPDPIVFATDKKPDLHACTEVGNFDLAEAKRFEARLAGLSLGDKLSRRNVQEVARHMVYIPSQGSKDGADKKSSELRQLGIKDFYVIQDGSDLKWGISLGIFKSEEAARAHLATLSQKGVRSARLGQYSATSNKIAFQLRALDTNAKANLDRIKADFRGIETRNCDAVQ